MDTIWWILIVIIVVIIGLIIWWVMSGDDETTETTETDKTDKTDETTEKFTPTDEIIVPVTMTNQYTNPQNNSIMTEDHTMQDLAETLPYRSQIEFDNYPSNPDLYPENGVEFRPENSMYTHLESNFLDIGPQIGVGTRVNSQRNGPQLLFRRQYAVPTMPTGYWNQSTISQPIFTNNTC